MNFALLHVKLFFYLYLVKPLKHSLIGVDGFVLDVSRSWQRMREVFILQVRQNASGQRRYIPIIFRLLPFDL